MHFFTATVKGACLKYSNSGKKIIGYLFIFFKRIVVQKTEDIAVKEHFVFVECHWSASGSSCAFPGGQKTLDPKSNYLIQYIGRRGHEICLIDCIAVTAHTQTHR